MPLDAAMLRCLATELNRDLIGARIERIVQPTKDEVVLHLHKNRENPRLLLNAGANYPRATLEKMPKENPLVAPMFCMLLRKHLTGAKLLAVEQIGFERALRFRWEAYDEMGFSCSKYLILEIMGRYSNLIFCDAEDKIYSALHIVDFTTSQKRQILPGMRYEEPPSQGKRDPLTATEAEFRDLRAQMQDVDDLTFLSKTYCGLAKYTLTQIVAAKTEDLWESFFAAMTALKAHTAKPYLVCDLQGKPIEFTFLVPQSTKETSVTQKDSFCDLLTDFYDARARAELMQRRSADLTHLLATATARLQKKIFLQEKELLETEERAKWKRYADAITGQMYALKSGAEQAVLWCYDTDEPTEITVPLQKNLTPAQNAQYYYKRYRKAKTAAQILAEQIEKAKGELAYLSTVSDSVTRAEGESDLSQIRAELAQMGYASTQKQSKTTQKAPTAKPMKFRTDGGFFVLCGKNNGQNDFITTKVGEKQDIWFHAKQIPGSHVLLQCADATPSDADLYQAAVIAATYSSADHGVKIEVDYTPLRYVKKPSGAKPGYVVYYQNQSAYVAPDPALCERLRME